MPALMAGGRFEQTSSLDACQKQRRRDSVYRGVGAVEFTLASHAPLSKRCFQPVAAARRGSRGGRPAMGAGSGSGRALAPWLLHTRRGSLTDGRPCGRSSCHPFADVRDEASGLGVQPALHAVESRASPNVRHRDAPCLSPRAARNAQSQFFSKREQACFQIRPTMHFPYLVIPICP